MRLQWGWILCITRSVDRMSDATTYIERGNVVISDHHSSAVLHIIMWWWWAIVILCGYKVINGYFKTYNPCRAKEATLLFTILYILYTVRYYLLIHRIHYHTIITNWMYWTKMTLGTYLSMTVTKGSDLGITSLDEGENLSHSSKLQWSEELY